MTKYINMKGDFGKETIDEFSTYKEAKKNLKEYRLSDPYNEYYLSHRCCNNWKNE